MNSVSVFILLIFLLPFCSAVTLGISPEKIDFSADENQKICCNFSVIGNNGGIFLGEIKWSKIDSGNIYDYNLSSESLGINASFPQEAAPGKYQLCLISKQSGNYYGILRYKLENSSYGVGTWIELHVSNNNFVKNLLSVTGNAIGGSLSVAGIWASSVVLLLAFLILLIIRTKKFKREELV